MADTNVIFKARAGGRGGRHYQNGFEGGCGGGGGSTIQTMGGNYASDNIVAGQLNIQPSLTSNYVVYGTIGGRNTYSTGELYIKCDGGGGGGIGEGGTSSGNINAIDAQETDGGKGGDGLYKATIDNIDYNFKTYFGLNGKLEDDGFYYIGGGGGGGDDDDNGDADGGGGGGD